MEIHGPTDVIDKPNSLLFIITILCKQWIIVLHIVLTVVDIASFVARSTPIELYLPLQ
jgi:hypothetical protein